MFGSVVIDVVIAMALVFTVFSLVTSGLRELVARVVSTRSKELWRSIRGLLEDPISGALRPLREWNERARDVHSGRRAAALTSAERRLRRARDASSEEGSWTDAVDATEAQLAEALPKIDSPEALAGARETAGDDFPSDPAKLIDEAAKVLGEAYRASDARFISRVADFIKPMSSKRPRVPVVPTTANVSALADSVRRGVRSLTDAVYDHPIVRQVDRTAPGARSAMDRLQSGDFSAAVLDLIRTAGLEDEIRRVWRSALDQIGIASSTAATEQIRERQTAWGQELKTRVGALPPNMKPLDAAAAIADIVDEVSELSTRDLTDMQPADAAQLRTLINQHGSSLATALRKLADEDPVKLIERGAEALESVGEVREVVMAVVAKVKRAEGEASDALDKVTADVSVWYDSRMDALSGWYRRRSRIVGFLIALVVVAAFNVDAVRLPRELWTNENVRSAVVAIADNAQVKLEECSALEGDAAAECVEGKVDLLIESGLPLGWTLFTDCDGNCGPWERIRYFAGMGQSAESPLGEAFDIGLKLFGWALAAAALSMGASFWFDVLRRAMGIRSAMKGEGAKS